MADRVVIDACVLYPTVLREIILGLADDGLFEPRWSARILEEWSRAVIKNIPDSQELVKGEIALCMSRWPKALLDAAPEIESGLSLPDVNDTHVLATAIHGDVSQIVTLNLKDFPRRILSQYGVNAVHPDVFLLGFLNQFPVKVGTTVENVRLRAEHLSGTSWPVRKLLKKARLPRLGKALEQRNVA